MAFKSGTAGNDILTGTTLDDQIYGYGGNDILIGSGGNDDMEGGANNDTMSGGSGNDSLDGGTGVDVLEGGTGDDTYYIDNVLDTINEGANAGLDTVRVSLSAYTLAANVENGFMLLDADTAVAGNVLNNSIYTKAGNDTVYAGGGNDFILAGAGNDVLYGGEGNDALFGEAGSNTLYGGANDDTYHLLDWTTTAAQTIVEQRDAGHDRVITQGIGGVGATGALGEAHSFTLGGNLEELIGDGKFAFNFKGNFLDNTIWGGAYADTLDGGTGADKLYGSGGADVYVIDNAGDRALNEMLDYRNMDTARITSAITWKLDSGVERVELIASGANITGSAFDDYFFGSIGSDSVHGGGGHDVIYGGGGLDLLEGDSGNDLLQSGNGAGSSTLVGGEGDDTYYLGSGADTVIELADGGKDAVHLTSDWVMAAGVEVAYVKSAFGLGVTGNDSANQIYGGAAADLLKGGLGADSLDGGGQGDVMEGGAGDDTYWVNMSTDKVVELLDEGVDTVYALTNHTLAANVENLILSGPANAGTGNGLDNIITAGIGVQTLRGNSGADVLTGGQGADVLTGGAANDVFVFAFGDNGAAAGQRDTITDFQRSKDKIDLTFLDSDTSNAVDDAALFLGTGAFTNHEGEIRFDLVAGGVQVLIDVNGDGAADMGLDLTGLTNLAVTDFIL